MKNKYYGLSTMGYVIASFIAIGIIMIFSAPMLIDNFTLSENNKGKINNQISDKEISANVVEQLASKINKLDKRVSNLEENLINQQNVLDKYVCSIEGTLNAEGEVAPIDDNADRFVFVCEYKK